MTHTARIVAFWTPCLHPIICESTRGVSLIVVFGLFINMYDVYLIVKCEEIRQINARGNGHFRTLLEYPFRMSVAKDLRDKAPPYAPYRRFRFIIVPLALSVRVRSGLSCAVAE